MRGGGAIAHGGRLSEALRRWPATPGPWIDLSTGINPVAYPMPVLGPADFTRLPEPDAVLALQAVAARAYGVADPACVVAAPGTQILINLLPLLWPSSDVAVLGPTYAEHAACWAQWGARVRAVTDFAALEGAHTAVVVNPNNPDGRRIPVQELVDLAAALACKGGGLVVDEAFADLEGLSVAPLLPLPGLVVLRSFGKTYGLAGVRLGFLLADAAFAARVRGALGPWAVSGPAIAVGCAALGDDGWRGASAARLDGDVARLDALLMGNGLSLVGGTRLFRLFAASNATSVHAHLGAHGILVRDFAEHPAWLRFGFPAPAQWDRLAAAMATAGWG